MLRLLSLALCVALFAAVYVVAAPTTVEEAADDPVYVVECCIDNAYPKNDPDSFCNDDFCTKVAKTQVEAFQKITIAKKLSKEEFLAMHEKSEGQEFADERYAALAGTSPKTVFLESALRFNRMKKGRTSDASENPMYTTTDVKWPKGVVTYHYSFGSASTSDKNTVTRAYEEGMDAWAKKTCIRFSKTSSSGVKLELSTLKEGYASSAGGKCGKHTSKIVIGVPWAVLQVTAHELGHCLGLQHTNTRADAATFGVTYDEAACGTHFKKKDMQCEVGKERKKADHETWCKNTAKTDPLKGGKLPADYDSSKADHLQLCVTYICLDGWFYQYKALGGTSDLPANKYDVNSIMHYPIDDCLKLATGKGTYDPTGEVIAYDHESVNAHYGCIKVNVSYNKLFKADVHFHPDLSLDEAKTDLATALGFKKWDASWKLKKATDKSEITTIGDLKTAGSVCFERSTLVNGC